MTITEFLTARLDEDEAAACAANEASAAYGHPDDAFDEAVNLAANEGGLPEAVNHMRRWGPEFVLADTAAKRAIVALHTHPSFACYWSHDSMEQHDPGEVCDTLCALALPYAEHPDFDESWKP